MDERTGAGIAAVSWGHDRIDLFERSADGSLGHRSFDGDRWTTTEDLGGSLASVLPHWAAGR